MALSSSRHGTLLKYATAGALATAAHFSCLIALVELGGLRPTIATALGFCAAIAVNYNLQYHWTFQASGTHGVVFVRYLAVTAVMLVLNTVLLSIGYEWIGWHYIPAQAVATLLVFGCNYSINRSYTFAQRE